MAEYIDRNLLGEVVDSHGNVHYENIMNTPTADVIERSKIDKAIEEINDAPVLFVDFPLGKHQVLIKDVVLDILKRNIGK